MPNGYHGGHDGPLVPGNEGPAPEKTQEELADDKHWRAIYDITKEALRKYIRNEAWINVMAGEVENRLREKLGKR